MWGSDYLGAVIPRKHHAKFGELTRPPHGAAAEHAAGRWRRHHDGGARRPRQRLRDTADRQAHCCRKTASRPAAVTKTAAPAAAFPRISKPAHRRLMEVGWQLSNLMGGFSGTNRDTVPLS